MRRILTATAWALGDMHAAGMLCVDLKPENLVLDVRQVRAVQHNERLKPPTSTCYTQYAWGSPRPSACLFD